MQVENGDGMETITLNGSNINQQMLIQGPNGEILQVINLKDATMISKALNSGHELKADDLMDNWSSVIFELNN